MEARIEEGVQFPWSGSPGTVLFRGVQSLKTGRRFPSLKGAGCAICGRKDTVSLPFQAMERGDADSTGLQALRGQPWKRVFRRAME